MGMVSSPTVGREPGRYGGIYRLARPVANPHLCNPKTPVRYAGILAGVCHLRKQGKSSLPPLTRPFIRRAGRRWCMQEHHTGEGD